MSDSNTPHLNPPASWEKFEDACADLFARIWDYPELERYGRQGQRQDGIDIYGKDKGDDAGVQCKEKCNWPPTELTIRQVDEAVEEAKKFRPQLKKLFIATTAPNDARMTDHANAVSARHAASGLFQLHVYGWGELSRRFHDYPDLVRKHFDQVVLRKIEQDIENAPNAIAKSVVRELRFAKLVDSDNSQVDPAPRQKALPDKLVDVLERDFDVRYQRALQRSMYPEAHTSDDFLKLAEEVLAESSGAVSSQLRRTILFRGARAAAIKERLDDADRYLKAGQALTGDESDKPALARIAVARGDADQAIRLLRDEANAESRSVLLSVLALKRGDDAALEWLKDVGLTVSQLTPLGVLNLCQLYLRKNDFDRAAEVLTAATGDQFSTAPYLYLLRGALAFARLFPNPDRPIAIAGLPMDVRLPSTLISGASLADSLDACLADFTRSLPAAKALELKEAPRWIEAYIQWCELLHPHRRANAREALRAEMQDFLKGVSRVQFAYIADIDFDSQPLQQYLQRRDALGGLTDEELRAAIAIKLNEGDAAGLAALIASKRQQADDAFGRSGIRELEIQALAKSGDKTSARIVLEENRGLFTPERIAAFETEIAKAGGADPVDEHRRLYEALKTPDALRAFVAALVAKKDHIGVARYAEMLYEQTRDRTALSLAAQATVYAGDGENLVRLVEAHPHLRAEGVRILLNYGWQLLRLGRLQEAKQVADEIQVNHPARRDLHLEYAIALETGEWEAVAGPLAAALEPDRDLDGLALIRAAHLAQASGQGKLMDLIAAALKKSPDDPTVLMGAYLLYIEEGLEEQREEPQEWFRKALALSGPDGPVQAVEMKQLLDQQVEWNKHARTVTEGITRGDIPFVVAAPALRTTIVDMILRNLIRNSSLVDGRKCAAIPLFSGKRLPVCLGAAGAVAFDISALLVLGWLGILSTVFNAFPKIVLPSGILAELFEGQRRIRGTQKSRLRKAIEVRDAIAAGKLKIIRTPSLVRDGLTREIGIELAALLSEAKASNGLVLRSAPVPRIGFQDTRDADMSAHAPMLCDMHSVLSALVDHNVIDEESERAAQQYFTLQDKGWLQSAKPDPTRPLFVDGLSLAYLQTVRLLPALLSAFKDVRIHVSTEEEATALIEHDRHAQDVLQIIETVRQAVRAANADRKVLFASRRSNTDGNDFDDIASTVNLVSDLGGADAVVVDDRGFNKEPFAADRSNHHAQIFTTLDVLEELVSRGLITQEQRKVARYRLRRAGALLVPVDAAELAAAAKRNRQNESPEFSVIHQSFDLARLSEIPRFPSEMHWFLSYVHSASRAISQIWNEETDENRARHLSDAILAMRPLPDDWIDRWDGAPPPNWLVAVRRALIGGFALPMDISDESKTEAYQNWFEESVLAPLREYSPETYEAVVGYLKEFVRMPWKNHDDGT
jgi:tetratricopeptide (TPR) repeat protein